MTNREAMEYLLEKLPKGTTIYVALLGLTERGETTIRRYNFLVTSGSAIIPLDWYLYQADIVVSKDFHEGAYSKPRHIAVKNGYWQDIVQRIGECLYDDKNAFPTEETQVLN
jgi:hypothetical protein